MSLLFESIKLEDGRFHNLFYHEQRMTRSLRLLCGEHEPFDLERYLLTQNPPLSGLFKCRLTYDDRSREVEFVPYEKKIIRTLRIVEHDRINYEFKYTDRKTLNRLYELKKDCDDVLIVRKGLVTDTSYCNIAFRRGKRWYTPWSALLKGTQRQKLIETGDLVQEEIGVDDLSSFDSFKLLNAMLEFDSPEFEVSNIVT